MIAVTSELRDTWVVNQLMQRTKCNLGNILVAGVIYLQHYFEKLKKKIKSWEASKCFVYKNTKKMKRNDREERSG